MAKTAEQLGAEVNLIDLADYPMPLFNQDLEKAEGMPTAAAEFKAQLMVHDGVLIASPEYNSAFSPLLKNALDWASRSTTKDEPGLVAFRGKVAGIVSASPGALGGLRGLVFLRMLLGNLGMLVVPQQHALRFASKAFDESGGLVDSTQTEAVSKVVQAVVDLVQRQNP